MNLCYDFFTLLFTDHQQVDSERINICASITLDHAQDIYNQAITSDVSLGPLQDRLYPGMHTEYCIEISISR